MNAINFVDGLDGLAAGIVGIGALAFFRLLYLPSYGHHPGHARRAGGLPRSSGDIAGLLPHNLNPARVFMGDTGSMLIGLVLASSVITLVGQLDPNVVPGPHLRARPLLLILLPSVVMAVPRSTCLAVVRATWARPQPVRPRQTAPAPPAARARYSQRQCRAAHVRLDQVAGLHR